MTELCFNVWYYLDRQQNIIAITAKAYMLDGDDRRKTKLLSELSRADYQSVHAYPLPTELRQRYPHGFRYSLLKQLGVEEVYKEVFKAIQRAVPSEVPFPDDKIFFATPLFDFGDGFAPAEIGNGFIMGRG